MVDGSCTLLQTNETVSSISSISAEFSSTSADSRRK
jgi:hypothetical protein